MSFFDKRRTAPAATSDGVPGTAEVVTVSVNRGDTVNQICEMNLVISAPGVTPLAVEFSGPVKRKVWPAPGAVLPILVDPADPTNYRILWDQVTPAKDAARAKAESVAALQREEPADAPADDVISRLERLAALRQSGALTEEEFAAQKAKVLG
ncbi:hypothetical protein ASC61_05775 [Aeromicrobium sp. Root344]|uniref:SHOCT domain-containing protein n=1 Tax=Aeromicrobium sp. Root344 TaxID=1736521 RepID=UPI0006F95F26|nr:SHOCT domain-containing protein [Aeromicrobium sp. Root344]KQV74550.1 hypothetical protein ASC61_05775 [Aeromicrobium sp. Root344]